MRKLLLTVLLSTSMIFSTVASVTVYGELSVASESEDTESMGTPVEETEKTDGEFDSKTEGSNETAEGSNETAGESGETAEESDETAGESDETAGESDDTAGESDETAEESDEKTEDGEGDAVIEEDEDIEESYEPVKIDGKMYLKKSDGTYYCGFYTDQEANKIMYFDENKGGAAAVAEVVLIKDSDTGEEKARLFDKNGYMVTETRMIKINGKIYIVKDGIAQTGWTTINNKTLYLYSSTYTAAVGIVKIDGQMRLFNDIGACFLGTKVVTLNGSKYYVKNDVLQSGWITTTGGKKMFFSTKNYTMYTGVKKINGIMRFFDKNGYNITGTKLITFNGKKYYVKNGVLQSGWVTLSSGKKMYFSTKNYAALNGVQVINKKAYLFKDNILVTATRKIVTVGGKKYYILKNKLCTGWATSPDGNLMYFDKTTYAALTGNVTLFNKTYKFDKYGYLKKGAVYVNGKTYYYKNNGTLYKNQWIVIGNERIYVDGNGVGLTDRSGYYKGTWSIRIDKSHNIITVYKGSVPVRAMTCSVGLNGKTPSGTFSLGQKYRIQELMGPSWGQYATKIVGIKGVYIHSVATANYYDVVHSVPTYEYNRLGNAASHGCIRVTVRDAKWIYDNVPTGTKVYIHNYSSNPLYTGTTLRVTDGSIYCSDPTDPAVW